MSQTSDIIRPALASACAELQKCIERRDYESTVSMATAVCKLAEALRYA